MYITKYAGDCMDKEIIVVPEQCLICALFHSSVTLRQVAYINL